MIHNFLFVAMAWQVDRRSWSLRHAPLVQYGLIADDHDVNMYMYVWNRYIVLLYGEIIRRNGWKSNIILYMYVYIFSHTDAYKP